MHQMGQLAEESLMYLIMSKNLFIMAFVVVFLFFFFSSWGFHGKERKNPFKKECVCFHSWAVDRYCWTVSGVPNYIFLSVSHVMFSS